MQRYHNSLEGILIASLLLLFLVFWLIALYKNRIPAKLLMLSAYAFFLLDVTLLNYNFMDTIPIDDTIYTDQNAAIRYFQKNPGRATDRD